MYKFVKNYTLESLAYPDYMVKAPIYIYIKGPFEVPQGKPRYTLLSPVTDLYTIFLGSDKYKQNVKIFYQFNHI